MPVWEVEYTDEFDDWYQSLTEEDQVAVIARVELLESTGLGVPTGTGGTTSTRRSPIADGLYDTHVEELREEGLI